MTKKRSSEIFADENLKNFREKVKFGNFPRSEKFFLETGGNLKKGENASLPKGMEAPGSTYEMTFVLLIVFLHEVLTTCARCLCTIRVLKSHGLSPESLYLVALKTGYYLIKTPL